MPKSVLSAPKPFAAYEWWLALRTLRTRRREGTISVIAGFSFLGILLGVATLIVVMAVMNGFRKELTSKILGVQGHILVQPIDSPFTDWQSLASQMRSVAGVKLVIPYVEGQALASSPTRASGVLVRGMRESEITQLPAFKTAIQQGTLAGFDASEGIVIGRRLAESFGLQVGDKLTLVSPRGAVTAFGTTPRVKSYPISAIFALEMSEYDSLFAFLPMDEAQRYFSQEGQVSAIELYIDNPDLVDEARLNLVNAIERPMSMLDWRQRNRTFFTALEVERNVMFIILTMIILVAALNIISGLIMLVKDKSSDIAILRTMGATRGSILRIFFITGASIGVFGTLFGLGLGMLICENVEHIRQFVTWLSGTELFPAELYFLSRLPAEMELGDVLAVTIMSLLLSLLATLYPAWRAAKLDPVEALRRGD